MSTKNMKSGATRRVGIYPRMNVIGVVFGILAAPLFAQTEQEARLSDDGRFVEVTAPGISDFRGISEAVYKSGEQAERVGSGSDKMIGGVSHRRCETPFGQATVSEATFGSPDGPFQYTIILKQLDNIDAFTLQAVFHNRSGDDAQLIAIDLLNTSENRGGVFKVGNSDDWLITPLMEDTPAFSLTAADTRLNEAALLYDKEENGFLVGPVGPAEAHTAVKVTKNSISAEVAMDGVLVRAGESRRSEEMIFAFEPIGMATHVWTRWVATTHGARFHPEPVYGWCSWYDRTTKIDEAHVLEVTKTIQENPDVFGKGIIQIDDGYQKMDGDWTANEKFPSGMADIASKIRAAGCTPGVWFAPLMMHPDHPWQKEHPDAMQVNAQGISSFMNPNSFHPDGANWINPSYPESKKFLAKIISDARENGMGYIKIDFNGIGSEFVDPTKTRLQAFRELYALYREAAGEDMYILSCLGRPTRGVIGYIDAARVGPDSHPAHFEKCLDSVLRFQIYDRVWWHNDADVSYLAPKLESRKVGFTPQGEGMWQTWHGAVALTGGTAMISEPIQMDDVKDVWRNFEIMRPSSREQAKLITLGKSPENQIFGFAAQRTYGDFAVYNLYNPSGEPKSLRLDFEDAGLPAGVKCGVYDFWTNTFLGFATDSYQTDPIESLSSKLLRFTPIHEATGDLPVLVGSNLHLSIGATEIDDIQAGASSLHIHLSDAGAQSGSLVFLSNRPLMAKASENCEVVSVKDLGNKLWQVDLSGRKWNEKQSVELEIAPAK